MDCARFPLKKIVFRFNQGGSYGEVTFTGRCVMERFIRNENIRLYRKLLEQEQDEERRNVIRKLLAEEETKDVRASPKGRSDNAKHR
jgi:hypothetical protein